MKAYGFDDYLRASRDWQALMVGALTVQRGIEALATYDAVDHTQHV